MKVYIRKTPAYYTKSEDETETSVTINCSVFIHFKDKEAIKENVLERFFDSLPKQLEEYLQYPEPVEGGIHIQCNINQHDVDIEALRETESPCKSCINCGYAPDFNYDERLCDIGIYAFGVCRLPNPKFTGNPSIFLQCGDPGPSNNNFKYTVKNSDGKIYYNSKSDCPTWKEK